MAETADSAQLAWADSTLAIMAQGWRAYQERLITALAPLGPEQLDLRVAPGLRSIRETATHIIGVRAGWFVQGLSVGGATLTAYREWMLPDAAPRSAAELVEGLRATWAVIEPAMAGWSPSDMAATVEGVYRGQPVFHVRGWVIWHLIEHDTHHGGEISYALGMYGLPGVDI